jgi:L-aminopeptidase/D-esterase-like protein
MSDLRPGATNTLVDVSGLRVGHAQRVGDGWLSGTTVVLAPGDGAVGGVDVRGGGPGTRETDLLDPRNQVERVQAVVLTGGSAYGLAACDGVVSRLADAGVGFPVGGPGEVVPIVPGAVVFDLGRGGDFGARPDAALGAAAYDAAAGEGGVRPLAQGCVGAGTGAVAGGLKGGVGSASTVLPDGTTVAALAVVNAVGSTVDLRTGELLGLRHVLVGEVDVLGRPDAADLQAAGDAAAALAQPGRVLATTLAVLATDARLTKAQCQKLAGIGHDGLARAIDPVHTMFDGDTVFALSTTDREAPDPVAFHVLLSAAGGCVSRAVVHAMLAATSVASPAGAWRSYRDAFPTAFRTSTKG